MARTNYCKLIVILLKSMAWFFRCFGVYTGRRNLASSSDAPVPNPVEPVVSGSDCDDWELKDEAKFLKACGTLQQTPDEIRKLPKKLKDLQDPVSEYHSWLPNISTSEFLENDNPTDQLSAPEMPGEINGTKLAAEVNPTPHSIINEQNEVLISISSLEDAIADNTKTTPDLHADGKPNATIVSISSPPAASKSEFLNRSVRFASPSLPSESSPQTCIQQRENTDRHGLPPITDSETSLSESSIEGYFTAGTNFPSEIKTPAIGGAGNEMKYKPGGNQEDRPILGLVAEHWKEADVSRISPKEWDGHGIPNTTRKYKEDQKVHWHATPFVERLEKALSKETFISRSCTAIQEVVAFTDEEERDTATCKLQSL